MNSILYIVIIVILLVAVTVMWSLYQKAKKLSVQYKEGIAVQKGYLQNMSHEIRTPMNAICGFSQILCNKQIRSMLSEKEVAEYGVIIQNNADLLSTFLDDFLDIVNMESGKYRLNMADCLVNDVCRKAIDIVKFRCPDHVEMYMTSDVPDDYKIKSDARRVQQVLTNYLTNAVKHTDEGEIHLHVSLTETPGMLTFSVTDTGEGVAEDKAEYIFIRFEKLKTIHGGTGLGLAICRTIATQLGGEAKLDSSYQQGARFLFTHPLDK